MIYPTYPDEPRSGDVAATLVYLMMGEDALKAFVKRAREAEWKPDELRTLADNNN